MELSGSNDQIKSLREILDINIVTKNTSLNLSNLDLIELPHELVDFDWVEELNISGNKLIVLKDVPKNLRILDASNNCISVIDIEHFDCDDVEIMDLSRNKLDTINVSYMKHLQKLSIKKNKFTELLSDIFCESLEELDAEKNIIIKVSLEDTKIITLNISNNHIKELYDHDLPKSLKSLDVSYNLLDENSFDVKELTQLLKINLNENKLSKIECKAYPDSLEVLRLNNNSIQQVTEIPKKIIFLDLEANGLEFFEVDQNELKKLYLENNKLKRLIKLSSSLRVLSAFNNDICYVDYFPEDLISLDLSYNKLANLPELPYGLEKCELENNNLTHLFFPTSIKVLNIENNRFLQCPIDYHHQANMDDFYDDNNPYTEEFSVSHNNFSDDEDTAIVFNTTHGKAIKLTDNYSVNPSGYNPITPYQQHVSHLHLQYNKQKTYNDVWAFDRDEINRLNLHGITVV